MTGKKEGIIYRGMLMFILCCTMLLSKPAMESRAATYTEAGVTYTYNYSTNGGMRVVITSVYVPSSITSVSVPAKIDGYPVVAIGADSAQYFTGAFSSNSHLLSVTLPDSVCEIYERAFEGLTKLETISLNGDGIVIGFNAFKGCNKLKVTFRGTGAVKYISGYAFDTTDSNCLDYNVIKNKADKDSWIGYDATWNNEAEWRTLVNGLTPFSVSVADDSNRNWEPTFDELNAANGYPNPEQIVSASTYTDDYNAWIRKSAKWVDSKEEQAEIRLDVAYNPMSGKSFNDMVFVLDVSGSMYFANNLIPGSDYSRQFQTFDQVRSVGKALLDLNENGIVYNRIGATMFNYGLKGSSRNAAGSTGGFFTDYASFIKWLDQENTIFNGSTAYSYGLDEAAYLIKNRSDKSRTPSVVFLSDGSPNGGTEGAFPGTGTSIVAHGGTSTTELSKLGVTRYCIMLGNINEIVQNKNYTALTAITYIAGVPGTSNDSTRTYASPDAATLQQAFQAILVQMTENLSLSLSDTAGEYFDVDATPTATGGGVSLSGASSSWNLSGTSPRQVYTLIIIQELKRDSNNYNAFFYGDNMETNLGNAVLEDVDLGSILSVASPALSKAAHEMVTIFVDVTLGVAIREDGTKSRKIEETIPRTGSYVANYEGDHASAVLVSVSVAAGEGLPPTEVPTGVGIPESYNITDARCNYIVYVVYKYDSPPTGTWAYRASAEGGTITTIPDEQEGIPLGTYKFVEYSPESDEFKLDHILIGIDGESEYRMTEEQFRDSQHLYWFPSNANADETHTVHVVYVKITETEEVDERSWGDYRR